jgi:hypothetical protein
MEGFQGPAYAIAKTLFGLLCDRLPNDNKIFSGWAKFDVIEIFVIDSGPVSKVKYLRTENGFARFMALVAGRIGYEDFNSCI